MIRVSGISKRFKIFPSPACRLKERIFNRSYHHEYLALSNITFEVNPGETMGIIGENGAGKSTLLKILSGVLLPDTGFVELSGKITGLLELGTGFNYELTGLENVFMNGTFLGMTNEEIEFKKNTIINFAELGVFINEPLKTYSSGMIMRLAFAIAIHADPECFLVDEALSVGDAYFQQKCMRKIQEFKEGGGSIIFVSHDLDAVKVLCDKAIRLKHGKIEKIGSPKEVVDSYINDLLINFHQGETKLEKVPVENNPNNNLAIATGEINLISVKIYNMNNEETSSIISGEKLKIIFEISSNRELLDPHYGIIIRNHLGLSVYESNTRILGVKTYPLSINRPSKIITIWKLPLFPGDYSISLGVANGGTGNNFEEYLFNMYDIIILKILQKEPCPTYAGIINLQPEIIVESIIN